MGFKSSSPKSSRAFKLKKPKNNNNKISVTEFIEKVSSSDMAQPNILIN